MKGSFGSMGDKWKKDLKWLEKFKYPLLIFALGILLMLVSGGSPKQTYIGTEGDELMAQILSSTKGVGEAKVLISDNGVVVVCSGADKAEVRLEIICAVKSYTGYSSDKITILKMSD